MAENGMSHSEASGPHNVMQVCVATVEAMYDLVLLEAMFTTIYMGTWTEICVHVSSTCYFIRALMLHRLICWIVLQLSGALDVDLHTEDHLYCRSII